MISPEQIQEKSRRLLPKIFSAMISGQSLFPLKIRSDKNSSDTSYETFRRELSLLLQHSKNKQGFGYTVEMRQVNAGLLKGQAVPEEISFATQEDFLQFLGEETNAVACLDASKLLLSVFPELKGWCLSFPLKLVQHKSVWREIILVLHYFKKNPSPNLYLRALPINVHTKFIETHATIIDELLQLLLPAETINLQETKFERRYNLRIDEPRIRLLLLDKSIADRFFSGCTELDLPVSAIARLSLPLKRVFVMENKQAYSQIYNFLTLPQQEGAAAIFGKGFSVGLLSQCDWLKSCHIFYWGDIDTHGLLILNRIRKYFPHTSSFLMNKKTLEAYKEYWGIGANTQQESLEYLLPEELELFKFLKEKNVRLEQEKILHKDVLQAIQNLL